MRNQDWSQITLAFLALLLFAGCGRTAELLTNQSAEFEAAAINQLGNDNPLSNAQFHSELQMMMGEVNESIAKAMLPSYTPNSLAANTASAAGCKPQIDLVLIGAGIKFTPSST